MKYFAYGSNLNITQMKRRCPNAKMIGRSYLYNHRLVYKGSKTGAYLTVEPCDNSTVPLGVWEITKADEKALDRYEGYPEFYRKEKLRLKLHDLNTLEFTGCCTGIIYIMNDNREYGLPSDYYVDVCRRGYADFGFGIKTLEKAYTDTEEVYDGVRKMQ